MNKSNVQHWALNRGRPREPREFPLSHARSNILDLDNGVGNQVKICLLKTAPDVSFSEEVPNKGWLDFWGSGLWLQMVFVGSLGRRAQNFFFSRSSCHSRIVKRVAFKPGGINERSEIFMRAPCSASHGKTAWQVIVGEL